jgi:hypothetical protein
MNETRRMTSYIFFWLLWWKKILRSQKLVIFLFREKTQILERAKMQAVATHNLMSLIFIFCILLCVALGPPIQEKWVEYSFIND